MSINIHKVRTDRLASVVGTEETLYNVYSLHMIFKTWPSKTTLLLLYSVFSGFNTDVLINDLCEILTCRVAFSY